LVPLEPGSLALEWFIGTCLFEAGVWESPRTSDGIVAIERVGEQGPEALRARGQIWEIDQSLHAFWLEIERAGDRFAWRLYYDVIASSERRAWDALSSHERAEDIEWRAAIAGEATIEGDALVFVPGSLRT
jgi:hypothetical protein